MKKRILSLISCVLLFFLLPFSVFAASDSLLIDDQAQLLSAEEESILTETAKNLCDTYGSDIVILTVNSLGGINAENYADGYYFTNGYREDGVLLLLAMAEREWYIYTSGNVFYSFTEHDIQTLGSVLTEYLGNGEYYLAFENYLNELPFYLRYLSKGSVISDVQITTALKSRPNILLSFVIGLAVAGIVVSVMISSMNTKRKQSSASSYLRSGSFFLRVNQDIFLYSKVNKVRRQQNTSTGGSRGSTSVHRSSGGRRHGGGGGRF